MNFRKDINGLRAIAVLSVVLFHFKPALLSGGFIGVDIFFVISGFLMTGLILGGLQSEKFSLKEFYLARVRRIVPALTVLCLVLLALGWFLMLPSEYAMLGKHAFSSEIFLSNIVYWREAGYFSALADEKWLLHTWSLSVEWQFYLIYPLVVFIGHKIFDIKNLKLLIVLGALASFLISIYLTFKFPASSYYLLTTRIWEMLVGASAFLYPFIFNAINKKWIEGIGALLIVTALIYISNGAFWPGYLALLPVAGAYLIIMANNQTSFLTSNSISQHIGKISYSIYLWHWPIVVAGYSMGFINESWYVIFGLLASLIIGFLSYRCVETFNWKANYLLLGILFTTTFIFGLVIYVSKGMITSYRPISVSDKASFSSYYARENYLKRIEKVYRQECNFFDETIMQVKEFGIDASCTKSQGEGGIFLWGDSHAQALSHGLLTELPSNTPFYQVATAGCAPIVGETSAQKGELKKSCDKSNSYALDKIAELKPTVVILAQRGTHEETDFNVLATELKGRGVNRVVLLGPLPQWLPTLPNAIIKRHWKADSRIDDNSLDQTILNTNRILRNVYGQHQHLQYISIIDGLCEDTNCIAIVNKEGAPLAWDYGHLTIEGSIYVARTIIYPSLGL